MKFMSIFERFFFFLIHTDFSFQKIFFNEFPWSLWVFLKDFSFFFIIIFYLKKFFFTNFHEVFEYFWKILLFWVIYLFFISYSMAQRTSTEVLNILRPHTERVNYLDYLDFSKVMNFLVNVYIFPLSKKR